MRPGIFFARRYAGAAVCAWLSFIPIAHGSASLRAAGVDAASATSASADAVMLQAATVQRPRSSIAPAILRVAANAAIPVNAIATNEDGSVAVAGTADGRIATSADGGRTWRWVWRDESAQVSGFSAAVYAPAARRFLLVETSGRLQMSDDGGTTWKASSARLDTNTTRLVASHSGTMLAFADKGAVLRASGNGDAWQRVKKNGSETFVDACFFQDAPIALAIDGSGALLRSVDDGVTWAEHPIRYGRGLRAVRCGERMAVAAGQVEIRSLTVLQTGRGEGSTNAYSGGVTMDVKTGALIIEPATGIVVRSDDRGANWSVAVKTSFPLAALAYDGTRQRYLAVGANGYLVSDDADAKAWNTLPTPDTANFVDIAMYGDDGAAIALTGDGMLYDTKDGGANWARVDAATTGAAAIAVAKHAVVAYGPHVSLVVESAASVPRVIGIASTRQTGDQLIVDVELDDPDGRCGKDCIEVAGWSEADYARRAKIAARTIGTESVSRPTARTIRVAFDPAATLSASENSNVHLYFTLKGAGFRQRFPANDGAYPLAYKPNWNSVVAVAVFGAVALLVALVFACRPIWIVFLACRAEKAADAVPVAIVQSAIKVAAAVMLGVLLYRRRVLAAWAAAQRDRFLRRLRLDAPQSYDYVPLPFEIRRGTASPTMADGIAADELRRATTATHPVIVISGTGGTGKSTLARRIAEQCASEGILAYSTLPVWFSADAATPAQIHERVREIADMPSLPAAFIDHLARGGFVLFVADGVSEAPQVARSAWEDFLKRGHVVVLTTRRNDALAGRDYTYFGTRNLDAHNAAALLTGTVTSLLRARSDGGAVLGVQAAMMTAFARLVGSDGLVSPLLVRLFARNYVARAVDALESGGGTTPALDVAPSATEVYFDYLADLHARKRSGNAALDSEPALFDACKTLATRELADDYLPKALKHDDGVDALKQALSVDDAAASAWLDRLVDDSILRTFSHAGNVMWRFEFDPVAEHVAARVLVERNPRKARKIIAASAGQADLPQGYLDAVRAVLRDEDNSPLR